MDANPALFAQFAPFNRRILKILHLSTPYSWRGGEQQIAYLSTEMKAMGIEQVFLCAEAGALHEFAEAEGFTVFPFRPGFLSLGSDAALLKRICKNYQIDLLHVHDSKAHTVAFVAAVLGNKTPILLSRKVDFPIDTNFLSRKKYNSPAIKKIICISAKIKEILSLSIKDTSKLTVVYDGIDLESIEKLPKADLRTEFNIPSDVKIIGNIAALAPHKDYFTFVDTAEKILAQQPKTKFMIVGAGELESQIKNYVKRKNLQDHIIMTGFREDAKSLLKAFDVFLTSSKTEGLGSSTLDAFAAGIPVVATNAGGIPEIVKDEETGLLAPVKSSDELAKQVLRILNDAELWKLLINTASMWVRNFDKREMAKKTVEVYREVLNT